MNKKEFIQKIKDIKVNVPDEEFFLDYNKVVYDILDNQENLIKYIEDKIKTAQKYLKSQSCKPQGDLSVYYYYAERDEKIYKDLLERIKK